PTTTTTTPTPTTTTTTTTPTTTTTTPTPTTTTTTKTPTTTTTTPTPTTTTTTKTPTTTTTTKTPTTTTTTKTPTTTTTTKTPTTTTSTAAPTNTTITAAPANTTITAAPANTTTTATTTTSSVISPDTSLRSQHCGGWQEGVSSTLIPSQLGPASDPCKEDPCSSGASCVGLNNSFFCLCTAGYYYNSSTCNKGKVFPGTIKVKVSETTGLEDEKSPAYEKLYMEIRTFFADAFKNPDYGQTVIHKVSFRTSAPARSEMRAGDKLVDVTVVNLFAETSEENETTVSNAINKAVASNPTFSDYTKENRCDFYGCVNEQDGCRDILVCKCKPGLSRPNPQTALCLALGPKCLDTCNAEHNMQCLVHSNGSSECRCLPGYQKDAKENCQACAFGYSGVDCEDPFQLILTIVGTVAGILILGMVIALIFLSNYRSKTKGIEEQNLIEDDYHSMRMSTTGFSNLGAEGSLFPKVRATFPKDSPMQNPYAQRSMPRPDY
uniref:SEA domain-containing protein n=1 Tax=Myotis lucifugus TaxID=59463 RepID=G1NV00_MYOLU